jgi:nitrile hydratase
VGDRIRISARYAPGHVRTPFYARGATGHIERVLDTFLDPEREAFGVNAGTETQLYRVRLNQSTLWPDYSGEPADVLELEIFEHWLEPAPESSEQENPS